MNLSRRWCPVCGCLTPHRELYRKLGYPILKCRSCGVGATQVSGAFDPRSYYSAAYFQGGVPDGYADYAGSEPVLRAEFRRVLEDLERLGIRSGNLLEVGCAYGFLLAEARSRFRVFGIEISREAAEFCRSRGLEVHCGPPEDSILACRGPFDVVLMLDVLEHLEDPSGALAQIGSHMKTGAALVLSTGDWESLLGRVMGRGWRLMTPPQHLYFFTRRCLYALLERLGFRVLRCARPWKRVPAGLVLYQLARLLHLPAPRARLAGVGIPLNLFDTVRLVAIKQ